MKEIGIGLTPEEAQRLRRGESLKRKATIKEKVELIKTLQSEFGLDIASPPPEPMVLPPKFPPKYADPKDVVARIRKIAAEELAQDPLLKPRSRSS